MVKLTPELIQQSCTHFNPIKDRELVLRGYKIPIIENLGCALDQHDTYDLSDNDIRKLDGFPHLKRLKCLLLSNNRIVRIADDLHEYLPNLESIYMTNNLIHELKDLEPLSKLSKVRHVSFLGNPVSTRQHYRLFIIHKAPQIRVIDFRRVRDKERATAKTLFKSKEGKDLQKEIKKTKTFTPGAKISGVKQQMGNMSLEDQTAIKEAIASAKSMEEVDRLQHMLRSGSIPNKGQGAKRKNEEE